MADVSAKVTIKKTPTKAYQSIVFQSLSANDVFIIPYRIAYRRYSKCYCVKSRWKIKK